MRAQWEAERQALKKVQTLRSEIEKIRHEAEAAERNYDLNRAAELRHGMLPDLERRLAAEEEQLAAKQAGRRLCARSSPRRRSPTSSRAGRASR